MTENSLVHMRAYNYPQPKIQEAFIKLTTLYMKLNNPAQ